MSGAHEPGRPPRLDAVEQRRARADERTCAAPGARGRCTDREGRRRSVRADGRPAQRT